MHTKPAAFIIKASQADTIHVLKIYYDELLKSISDIVLPSCLANFDEFRKLDADAAIKALYEDIADKTKDPIVHKNVYTLMTQVVGSADKNISTKTYQYIRLLDTSIRQSTGEQLDAVRAFIGDTSQFLFADTLSLDNSSSEAILKEIEKFSEIVQKTSNLFYQKIPNPDKETLKQYSLVMWPSLLRKINRVLHIIVKNPQSEDYLVHLDSALMNLKKMSEAKGITTLFGKDFFSTMQGHLRYISNLQQFDQFLSCDFSKPVAQKQEQSILTWVQSYSELGIDFLTLRVSDAFKYQYQIHSILTLKDNSDLFKKNVTKSYDNFKKNLCDYAKDFKFGNENSRSLLAIFGVVLSGIDIYNSYDRNTKFQLQAEMKKNYENTKTSLNQYFCFYIDVLNYIPFFQDNVKIKKIKELSEKLIEVQKITDDHTKYFIKGGAEKLLEYFAKAKEIIIPKPTPVDLNAIREELLYLKELKNFYDVFFTTICSVSPKFRPNETMLSFVERLEHQRVASEIILAANERASAIPSLFKSVPQNISALKRGWKKERFKKKSEFLKEIKTLNLVPFLKPADKKDVPENVSDERVEQKSDHLTKEKTPIMGPLLKPADKNDVPEKISDERVEKKSDHLTKEKTPIMVAFFKPDLNTLIAETIPVILVYYRLNALGYSETWMPKYKSHSYKNKLAALFKALKENSPDMLLDDPEAWVDLLGRVLSETESVDIFYTLLFVVGVSYEENKKYNIAEKFYSYCLKHSYFEIPTEENKDSYLITEELIEKHKETCVDEKRYLEVASEASCSSSPQPISGVSSNNAVPQNSKTVIKTDTEVLPISSPNIFY